MEDQYVKPNGGLFTFLINRQGKLSILQVSYNVKEGRVWLTHFSIKTHDILSSCKDMQCNTIKFASNNFYPSIFYLSGSRPLGQQPKQTRPNLPLLSHVLCLVQGSTKVFPDQSRGIISPA